MKARHAVALGVGTVLAMGVASPYAFAQELAVASPTDRWQIRRLMQPTPKEIERENRGEVFIYENLKDTEVRAALDAHFGRIDHMMFVGTVKTGEAGEVQRDPATNAPMVEDNGGC